ncbi:MAG: ssDNA-binding protein, partial [Leifsonia sp.]
MARDYKKCIILKDKAGGATGILVLPKAKMLYPALFEPSLPKGEKDQSKAKYGMTLLMPKDADLTPLKELVAEAISEKWGAKAKEMKIKKPFIKVSTEDEPKTVARLEAAGIDPADFPVMLRVFGNYKPVVKGPDATSEVRDDEQVYEGRWACVSINVYAWEHPTGGKGISIGLQNVQLLDNDDVIPRGGSSVSG